MVLVHAVDVLAIVLGGLATTFVGLGAEGAGAVLAVLLLVPVVFCGGGAPTRLTLRALDELPRMFGWVGVCLLFVVPIGVATGTGDGLLAQAAGTAVVLCIGRGTSYGVIRRLRRSGRLRNRAVIVGAGVVGTEIERVVRQHPELGVDVVGFIDTRVPDGPPVLGDVDEVELILERYQARRVIVAFGLRREAELVDLLRRLALLISTSTSCRASSTSVWHRVRCVESTTSGVSRCTTSRGPASAGRHGPRSASST
jgi:FlaA1/EpsC-like NDP-sugar epimerase